MLELDSINMDLETCLYQSSENIPLPGPIKKSIEYSYHSSKSNCPKSEKIAKIQNKFYLYDVKKYFKKQSGREYEGYMGNGGGALDHWYNKIVAIFFPKNFYKNLIAKDEMVGYYQLEGAIIDHYEKKLGLGLEFDQTDLDELLQDMNKLNERGESENLPRPSIDRDQIKRMIKILNFFRFHENQSKITKNVYLKLLKMRRVLPLEYLLDIRPPNLDLDETHIFDHFSRELELDEADKPDLPDSEIEIEEAENFSYNFIKDLIDFQNDTNNFKIEEILKARNYSDGTIEEIKKILAEAILDLNKTENRSTLVPKKKETHDKYSYRYSRIKKNERTDRDMNRKARFTVSEGRKKDDEPKYEMKLDEKYYNEGLESLLKFLASFHAHADTNSNINCSYIPTFLQNQPDHLINFQTLKPLIHLHNQSWPVQCKLSKKILRLSFQKLSKKFCQILSSKVDFKNWDQKMLHDTKLFNYEKFDEKYLNYLIEKVPDEYFIEFCRFFVDCDEVVDHTRASNQGAPGQLNSAQRASEGLDASGVRTEESQGVACVLQQP